MMICPAIDLRTVLEVRQVPARGWRFRVSISGEPVFEAGKRGARGGCTCRGLGRYCPGLLDVLLNLRFVRVLNVIPTGRTGCGLN